MRELCPKIKQDDPAIGSWVFHEIGYFLVKVSKTKSLRISVNLAPLLRLEFKCFASNNTFLYLEKFLSMVLDWKAQGLRIDLYWIQRATTPGIAIASFPSRILKNFSEDFLSLLCNNLLPIF